MSKNTVIKIVVCLIILTISIGVGIFFWMSKDKVELRDTVKYEGNTYVLLEYNLDVFTYNFNSTEEFYDEDEVHPVKHDKWDIVYFGGDLFVLDKQVEEATLYYKDDNNYEWFIVYEEDDKENSKTIAITKEEIEFLYKLDEATREESIAFNKIEQFADIVKISKDGFVEGIISLAKYKDSWYWKTEVMTDDDKEYVIPLSQSLNSKIVDLFTKK